MLGRESTEILINRYHDALIEDICPEQSLCYTTGAMEDDTEQNKYIEDGGYTADTVRQLKRPMGYYRLGLLHHVLPASSF